MENTISLKNTKDSTAKPNGKPLIRNKKVGIDPATRFYEIEDIDKTE